MILHAEAFRGIKVQGLRRIITENPWLGVTQHRITSRLVRLTKTGYCVRSLQVRPDA